VGSCGQVGQLRPGALHGPGPSRAGAEGDPVMAGALRCVGFSRDVETEARPSLRIWVDSGSNQHRAGITLNHAKSQIGSFSHPSTRITVSANRTQRQAAKTVTRARALPNWPVSRLSRLATSPFPPRNPGLINRGLCHTSPWQAATALTTMRFLPTDGVHQAAARAVRTCSSLRIEVLFELILSNMRLNPLRGNVQLGCP
jgi:hypothetical protein